MCPKAFALRQLELKEGGTYQRHKGRLHLHHSTKCRVLDIGLDIIITNPFILSQQQRNHILVGLLSSRPLYNFDPSLTGRPAQGPWSWGDLRLHLVQPASGRDGQVADWLQEASSRGQAQQVSRIRCPQKVAALNEESADAMGHYIVHMVSSITFFPIGRTTCGQTSQQCSVSSAELSSASTRTPSDCLRSGNFWRPGQGWQHSQGKKTATVRQSS